MAALQLLYPLFNILTSVIKFKVPFFQIGILQFFATTLALFFFFDVVCAKMECIIGEIFGG